jgi:hypothetical protein
MLLVWVHLGLAVHGGRPTSSVLVLMGVLRGGFIRGGRRRVLLLLRRGCAPLAELPDHLHGVDWRPILTPLNRKRGRAPSLLTPVLAENVCLCPHGG